MANDCVLLTKSDGIAIISFNRPQALNAIDRPAAEAFISAVTAVASNPEVRVIILRGEGSAFVAGGDVVAFKKGGDRIAEIVDEIIDPMHEAMIRLNETDKPTIASVHGAVAGAGMSLAMACDLTIAADNAIFKMAYLGIGISPDCGGSWWLSRLLGVKRALELALLNPTINASRALELGLVNKVVPETELDRVTMEIAARLVKSAPLALGSTRRLIKEAQVNSLAAHLQEEKRHFIKNAGSEDFMEGVTAFLEKRNPEYHGR